MSTISFLLTLASRFYKGVSGAGGGSRTLMPVRAGDFESPASAIPPLRREEMDISRNPWAKEGWLYGPTLRSRIRRVKRKTTTTPMTTRAIQIISFPAES
jgi:hypothetical protein